MFHFVWITYVKIGKNVNNEEHENGFNLNQNKKNLQLSNKINEFRIVFDSRPLSICLQSLKHFSLIHLHIILKKFNKIHLYLNQGLENSSSATFKIVNKNVSFSCRAFFTVAYSL